MSITKRGNRWWVDFTFKSRRYRFNSPDNSRAGALAYEALLKHKLTIGEDILEPRKEPMKTFKEFSDTWYKTYVTTNNKPSEQKQKETNLRVHLVPFFGKIAVDKINE